MTESYAYPDGTSAVNNNAEQLETEEVVGEVEVEVEKDESPPEWALNLEAIFKDLGMDTRVAPEVCYGELPHLSPNSNDSTSGRFPPFAGVYRNISFFAYGREDVDEFRSSQTLRKDDDNRYQMPTLLGRIKKPTLAETNYGRYQCALTQMYVRPNEISFVELNELHECKIVKVLWSSPQSIPVIVNGNLVANLFCTPSQQFVLTMYAPEGIISGIHDKWETVPLVKWPKDVVRDMLRRVERLINVYIWDDLYNQSYFKIQQILLEKVYHDENMSDLVDYFQISNRVNIAEMRLEKIYNRIERQENMFADAQDTISNLLSSLSESRLLKKALEYLPEENKMFSAVNNDRIISWYSLHDVLYFYTDDIHLVPLYVGSALEDDMDEDGAINIGCYCIKIELNGEIDAESITLTAMNGGVEAMEEGMQHPHVFPSGKACFGTYLNSVMDTLADLDIRTLLDVLIAFLSACDPDDTAGKYWVRWIDESYDPDMND